MKGTIRLLRICFLSVFFLGVCSGLCDAQHPQDILKVLNQLNTAKNNFQRTDILNKLARLYFYRSLDSSLFYTLDAKTLAEKNGYQKGIAQAYANYVPYYAEIGNPYMAYKFANSALDIFRSLDDKEGQFDVLLSISHISAMENKVDQAINYWDQMNEICKSVQNDSLWMINYLFRATLYANKMPWAETNNLLEQSNKIAKKNNDSLTILGTQLYKGILGFQFGEQSQEKSLMLAKPAVIGVENLGNIYLATIGNMCVGNMYRMAGITDSAEIAYQKALQLAESGGYLNLHMMVIIAGLQNATGKPGMEYAVIKYNKLNQKISKILAAQNQNDGFSLLEATLKEKDLQLIEIHDKAKQSWILFFSAMSFSLLLCLFFFYRSYKQKQKFLLAQKQLIEELKWKNNVLQENNEFNKNLISVMAHDLRQPFSSIIMLDRTTAKDDMQKEQYMYIIKQMRITSEKSIQIMDGLLQWMKLQLLGKGFQASSISLFNNINEALSFNVDAIARKKIRIRNEISIEIMIDAQPEMLLFINRNLLNNAVKYSPYSGEIRICAAINNNQLRVSIGDEGEGIPPEEMKHLFQSPKGNQADANTVKGAGIALYICKDMILKMKGRIWAENNPETSGAVFFYALPITQSHVSGNPLLKLDSPSSLN